MIKWDKPCYKCLSHFCDLSCKEPKHLQAPQPKEPEQEPVLEEREACAKIADEWVAAYPHPSRTIAEWIRKRGQA